MKISEEKLATFSNLVSKIHARRSMEANVCRTSILRILLVNVRMEEWAKNASKGMRVSKRGILAGMAEFVKILTLILDSNVSVQMVFMVKNVSIRSRLRPQQLKNKPRKSPKKRLLQTLKSKKSKNSCPLKNSNQVYRSFQIYSTRI